MQLISLARKKLAFDDPIVWLLIAGVVILLFGSNKIPALARGIGRARREFELASKGLSDDTSKKEN